MEDNRSALFSKDQWMAFVAHATMAVLVVGPIAYAMAKDVAKSEADVAVARASQEIKPQLVDIRERQATFSADINYIKQRLDKAEVKTDKILDKLDAIQGDMYRQPH